MTIVGSRVVEWERLRLAALHEYELLDAPADDELEAVVRVAATIAGVPTATLNLIDENRQCQLTTVGFEGGDSARSDSMCAVQLDTKQFVLVRDASVDPVYRDNPWVTGMLADVRFYASAPLVTPEGYALGTLCVFDSVPGWLTDEQIARLKDLAAVLLALFERRRQARLHALLAADAERRQHFTDTVLETIDVAVVAADPAGHLTLFNRASRDWHGLDADPRLTPADHPHRYSLFDSDGVTPLTPERVPLMRTLREGAVDNAEIVIRPADRDSRRVSASGRALVDGDGTLMGAVVAMSDVTADRVQRWALQQAHAELAERGRQLSATVRELERSNTELAQFAGAVSHDLVAPLGVVKGYLELLADTGGLAPRSHAWVLTCTRAVIRMQNLIEALLSYARAGDAPCRLEDTDVGEVLDNALSDLRGCIEESGAVITVPEALPRVDCDPTLIRQLLQNLIGNAVKYRHLDRPCHITVQAVAGDEGWSFSVADNGIGIPADQRQRVFEMFAQVDPAVRTGHGIGLSTCQRIVERHCGRIRAEETAGGGTTMIFTLPYPGRGDPAVVTGRETGIRNAASPVA